MNAPVSRLPTDASREDADIDASSEEYAGRFEGLVGRWFLETQTRLTLAALRGIPRGAHVLDVGGGHAQVAPALTEAGFHVTVVGSARSCGRRLEPWTARGRCRFDVADLQRLPYRDRQFDAVTCYRLLAHSVHWTGLIGELCRVARERVVVDYPSRRSVNVVSQRLFDMKRSIEGALTRPFALYHPREIAAAFASAGFLIERATPQFFLPMVLYRFTGSARLGRVLEWPARKSGLTGLLGSPVIVRADRRRA
jgi:SAM-dependent methyltransferase